MAVRCTPQYAHEDRIRLGSYRVTVDMADSVGMMDLYSVFCTQYTAPCSSDRVIAKTSRWPLDRVFVHALNTVKRIPRTGTARPPAAERLKLYGLYKQSMGNCDIYMTRGNRMGTDRIKLTICVYTEGDVTGVMDRPIGNTPDVQAECEKWCVSI